MYIPFIKRFYCASRYQVISFSVPVFLIDKATQVAQAALQQPGLDPWPGHCEKHDEHQGKEMDDFPSHPGKWVCTSRTNYNLQQTHHQTNI